MTRNDFLRQKREARKEMRALAKLYHEAFDKNGRPLVAALRLLPETTR